VFHARPDDVKQLIGDYHWQTQIFYEGQLVNFGLVEFARLLASERKKRKKLTKVWRNHFFKESFVRCRGILRVLWDIFLAGESEIS